ncbi:MAG TPA: hypothetical protein VL651_00990 [Bacteroidia bacterium]|jgi:hypothetical protein|nr:hypothetical protein [Bacteroidia bacterium]
MKYTETIDTSHELATGLHDLHKESNQWLHSIYEWEKESYAMIKRAEKIKASREVMKEIRKIANGLSLLNSLFDKLYSDISQHKHSLFLLLKETRPDEEAYRAKHELLKERFRAEEDHFRDLGREMFKMEEAAY